MVMPVHSLILESPVQLDVNSRLEAGPEYIVDDVSGAQMLVLAGGGRMEPLTERPIALPRPSEHGSKLVMRMGGFGDLVLLTPVLREHKRRFPDVRIGVSTLGHYAPVLAGLEYVDEILPYPVTRDTLYEWESWVFGENAIERNPRAKELHMTDVFAELAGIGGEFDKKPDYRVKATEMIWANESFPRTVKKRAAMQVSASGRCRIYPMRGHVVRELVDRGWEVILLGQKGDLPAAQKEVEGVTDLTSRGLTFRQSVAAMNTADVVIAPDSALLHVAGALSIPAVGTFGPFPWKLRTAYCPTTVALTGAGDCAPCYFHPNIARNQHFPDNCPTRAKGYCGVLADIDPRRVVTKAEQIARTIGPNGHALELVPEGR